MVVVVGVVVVVVVVVVVLHLPTLQLSLVCQIGLTFSTPHSNNLNLNQCV